MMQSTADFEMPNSGASWRIVKFVRQYAVTSSVWSSSDNPHGRPQWSVSTPAPRSTVTSLRTGAGSAR